jgi:hypothetical protein
MVIAEVKLKLASRKDVYEKVVYFGVEDGDILSVIQHLKFCRQSYPGGGGAAPPPQTRKWAPAEQLLMPPSFYLVSPRRLFSGFISSRFRIVPDFLFDSTCVLRLAFGSVH